MIPDPLFHNLNLPSVIFSVQVNNFQSCTNQPSLLASQIPEAHTNIKGTETSSVATVWNEALLPQPNRWIFDLSLRLVFLFFPFPPPPFHHHHNPLPTTNWLGANSFDVRINKYFFDGVDIYCCCHVWTTVVIFLLLNFLNLLCLVWRIHFHFIPSLSCRLIKRKFMKCGANLGGIS